MYNLFSIVQLYNVQSILYCPCGFKNSDVFLSNMFSFFALLTKAKVCLKMKEKKHETVLMSSWAGPQWGAGDLFLQSVHHAAQVSGSSLS